MFGKSLKLSVLGCAAGLLAAAVLAAPALDTCAGAAPVSYTTATLQGNFTAASMATDVISVFWGPADGGEDTNNRANTNSLGWRGTGTFFTAVSGLELGAPHAYRCYGVNDFGAGTIH